MVTARVVAALTLLILAGAMGWLVSRASAAAALAAVSIASAAWCRWLERHEPSL